MELSFKPQDCLEWAVAETVGADGLAARVAGSTSLRVKLGIDPTSPDLHLGRSIPVWRLRAFQELGHEIHLIIGDFTGQIGDTSDKESERPMLSEEEVKRNLEHYVEQLWMILNKERESQVFFHYNSQWLAPLTFAQIGRMADAFSVNSFVKRELVAKRLSEGSRVSLREMLYPLMQGYDSVEVKADIELGGTDQRFNLLAGRTLQEQAGQKPQAIIMNPLIRGTDGRKMSSSWGNVITLRDTPTDKFGKVMRIADDLMEEYLLVLPTSARPFSAEELAQRLAAGENPRDLKLQLARNLVELYHGPEAAAHAYEEFIQVFTQHERPADIPLFTPAEDKTLLTVLVAAELAPTRSEARRLIDQGGIRINDAVASDPHALVAPGSIIQAGKRRFVQISE